tara:strand:- start:307 stop:525 length:219 start_codon:yes stop_codon:yes gene_type:complete
MKTVVVCPGQDNEADLKELTRLAEQGGASAQYKIDPAYANGEVVRMIHRTEEVYSNLGTLDAHISGKINELW